MSLKVLIVDDDSVIVLLHKEMVRRFISPEVQCFLNGKKALDYLTEHYIEGGPILILLDINMPVMNGWELLDALQALPSSNLISVIMVTSSIDTRDKERAKQYPQVIDFVEKPLSIKTCNRLKQLPQMVGLL
jgi:CheY-like chemotaxis protein